FVIVGSAAADPVPVSYAHGVVESANRDSITILPRGADGKFAKKIILKVTGTSKINTLRMQKRATKLKPVQNDTDEKDLKGKQPIAVIYTGGKEQVLLTAVVQAAP